MKKKVKTKKKRRAGNSERKGIKIQNRVKEARPGGMEEGESKNRRQKQERKDRPGDNSGSRKEIKREQNIKFIKSPNYIT